MKGMRNAAAGLLLLALLLAASCALAAASTEKLVVRRSAPQTSLAKMEYITSVTINRTEYVFLPGDWDASSLYFSLLGKESEPEELSAYSDNGFSWEGSSCSVTDLFTTPSFTLCSEKNRSSTKVVVKQGSRISTMFIHTTDAIRKIHRGKKYSDSGSVQMHDEVGDLCYSGGLSSIRIRGNVTAEQPKKPYQIKLSEKADLLGSGKAKTYCLIADYFDVSMLRNRITMELAQFAGMKFVTASKPVDLYINGEYMGLYLLTEKVQIHPARVDITDMEEEMEYLAAQSEANTRFRSVKLEDGSSYSGYAGAPEPEDPTGGFLIEVDKAHRVRSSKAPSVFTSYGLGIEIKSPQQASLDQARYLNGLITAFDRAIRSSDGVDPKTGKHYSDIMDKESFVKKYMLEEIACNYDFRAGSQFYYKDSDLIDGKLYAGPPWDYDLSFGSPMDNPPDEPFIPDLYIDFSWYCNAWRYQADFRLAVAQSYWRDFRRGLMILTGQSAPAEGESLRSIDSYAAEISKSVAMNNTLWNPKKIPKINQRMGGSFENAVLRLKEFITLRTQALDHLLATP